MLRIPFQIPCVGSPNDVCSLTPHFPLPTSLQLLWCFHITWARPAHASSGLVSLREKAHTRAFTGLPLGVLFLLFCFLSVVVGCAHTSVSLTTLYKTGAANASCAVLVNLPRISNSPVCWAVAQLTRLLIVSPHKNVQFLHGRRGWQLARAKGEG